MSQAVVAYKVGKKRVAKVCADRFAVSRLVDSLNGKFSEMAIYAAWSATGHVETCSLTRNKGCNLVQGKPRFKRRASDASLPLVIAVKRQS